MSAPVFEFSPETTDTRSAERAPMVPPRIGERRRLVAEIATARRRIVVARVALAGSQDAELGAVLSVQRLLAEEQQATNRAEAAIFRDAALEVARILGRTSPASDDRRTVEYPPLQAVDDGPPAEAGHDDAGPDLVWLQLELDRLRAKAEIFERNARRAAAEPASHTRQADNSVLQTLLTNVLEVSRERQARMRERAAREAENRLANARAEAQGEPSVSPSARPFEPPSERRESMPRALAGPAVAEASPGSSPGVRRREPSKDPLSRPIVVDILIPLIAVAIVLIVVLSWIG